MKYSDCIGDWLVGLGYTDCFYVAGGNIMHLLASLSERLNCHPVINEVAAGIATEYFNEASEGKKALTLVTAGPGLTNVITAMAGAYLESRELLVIGGQVKTQDLSRGEVRQRGIQEVDGVAISRPVTVKSSLLESPVSFEEFSAAIDGGAQGRKGPVFLEIPLDVQAREVERESVNFSLARPKPLPRISEIELSQVLSWIKASERPIFLVGGGVSRKGMQGAIGGLAGSHIPIATTWNGADRIEAAHPLYVGRPNTWGQRSSNLVLQQADLVIALGTRLGMQQTGFNWQEFVPCGRVIQVDIDKRELEKGHPKVDFAICADADDVIAKLAESDLRSHGGWLSYVQSIRAEIPLIEPVNTTGDQYISPFEFVDTLSHQCTNNDVIVPCSSGGSFTVMMQTFAQKKGQLMITNKGLASMGYGLSGAIGSAFAHPDRRVILVEGDGGFAQNLQEIGTVGINQLNIKIFIFDDAGYASIRMTQRNYFGGEYVGCDTKTGLGLPNWERLFSAWSIPTFRVNRGYQNNPEFKTLFVSDQPAAFIVSIDPEQTYFPKITSKITESGAMASNPLHRMTPDLGKAVLEKIGQFLPK